MAENADPLNPNCIYGRHFQVQQENFIRARRSFEHTSGAVVLTQTECSDILTSHPPENFGSCRYRNASYGRDSRYCEIVQKGPVENLNRLQLYPHVRFYPREIHRRQRTNFTCRKRLHRSHFSNKRHRHFAAYSESRDYRRRRNTTPSQRKAANVREQKRMMNLKDAFRSLRESLPTLSYERKLSRIDTLRLAIMYITFLKQLADGKQPEEVQWSEIKP